MQMAKPKAEQQVMYMAAVGLKGAFFMKYSDCEHTQCIKKGDY